MSTVPPPPETVVLPPPPPPPPPVAPAAPSGPHKEGRASLSVFTNRSFWRRTALVYSDKFYADTWLMEKQKLGVRLPHTFELYYEVTISRQDWARIHKNIAKRLAPHEIKPEQEFGENNIMWFKCMRTRVMWELKAAVGWRRFGRQYYSQEAAFWRYLRLGLVGGLLVGGYCVYIF